jgi:hypothetical protein
MNELDIKILMIELLIANHDSEFVTTYKAFEQTTGATKKEIQPIVKGLVGIGMIELVTAWDDEGMLKGSGYMLTPRATQWSIREWLVELKELVK